MKRIKLIILVHLLIFPLTVLIFFSIPVHAVDLPTNIHLTWQNDTSTTITVTWQTSSSFSGDLVHYDNISRGGVAGAYLFNATGINFTYSGATGFIHVVELTGLDPDTIYYFICGGPIEGYSNERSFRTAPLVSSHVRFVAGGDSRSQPDEREKISQAMAKFDPDFVMHVGDMVNTGTNQAEWDLWFVDLHNNWIGDNNQTIPIMPASGSHELHSINYYSQFALPGNERWFSYDWGPDIHIIILNSEPPLQAGQLEWLENDLATHANYTWKFAIFHQPAFPATRPSGNLDILTYWVPLFDKYHVDIVFVGHDHAYLRTKPINWTASQTEPQPYANSTVYVVTGGWGAPLYTLGTHWYDAYGIEEYHFCLIDIFENGSLHIQAKNNQGNTFDEAWIIKNQSLPLNVSINLTSPILKDFNLLPIDVTWNTTGIIDHYNVYIGGQFKQYIPSITKSYQITSLTEGTHLLEVVAVDPLDFTYNASLTLNYDITPPNTTDDYDGLWHIEDFSINLTGEDGLSGVAETYFRINGGSTNNISAHSQPFITSEGDNNTLEYWSVDNSSNEELPHNFLMEIKLDKTVPNADAGGNQTIEAGTAFLFNGSQSTDTVAIADFNWSFTDNTTKKYAGETFLYTFNQTGLYMVTLNVSDYVGRWDIDVIWINVTDSCVPVANFTVIQTATIGVSLIFNATQSTDNVGIVTYIWDFGDGNQVITLIPLATHVYLTPGEYFVNLTVIDAANNSGSTILRVVIGLGGELQFDFPWWLLGLLLCEVGTIAILMYWDFKKGISERKEGLRSKKLSGTSPHN